MPRRASLSEIKAHRAAAGFPEGSAQRANRSSRVGGYWQALRESNPSFQIENLAS
jgi:hypothetical protein